MKKLFRKLKVRHIDVYIYKMDHFVQLNIPDFKYSINRASEKGKSRYFIKENDILVHESYLFTKVFLLRSLNKRGPVIGDCFTNKQYRGQSIYPYVINRIANEVMESGKKEIFVVVNTTNIGSIRGIEKAGFVKLAAIKAKRWLWFYLKREITYHQSK